MTNIKKHIETLHKKISELTSLDDKIHTIASYTKIITGARRCSLFIITEDKSQLQSIYNDEIKEHIILQSNVGLVGYAFHKKKTVLENDVTKNPVFFSSIDTQFNFTTRNILAVPILDNNDNCHGVIELLNKKMGFNEDDKKHIEMLVPLISSILISEKLITEDSINDRVSGLDLLQTNLTAYLDDKRLYLMGNGNAYYKILDMKRTYFIGADTCYQLSEEPTQVEIYYYTDEKEFLSVNIKAKFSNETKQILISEKKTKENFKYYPFEKDM